MTRLRDHAVGQFLGLNCPTWRFPSAAVLSGELAVVLNSGPCFLTLVFVQASFSFRRECARAVTACLSCLNTRAVLFVIHVPCWEFFLCRHLGFWCFGTGSPTPPREGSQSTWSVVSVAFPCHAPCLLTCTTCHYFSRTECPTTTSVALG